MKKVFVLLVLVIFIAGCGESITYKYQNNELNMAYQGEDTNLLKEALYSFENDIAVYYENEEYSLGPSVNVEYGYASFIYPSASGTADFKKIASPHTTKIVELLKKEESLWNKNGKDSKLNYNHELVKCLINNIQNAEIKERIETLLDANYFSPTIMTEFYRVNIGDALTDKNFALFIALETYYQNLLEIDFSSETKNE